MQWTALETKRPVWTEGNEEILFFPGGGFTDRLNRLWYVYDKFNYLTND